MRGKNKEGRRKERNEAWGLGKQGVFIIKFFLHMGDCLASWLGMEAGSWYRVVQYGCKPCNMFAKLIHRNLCNASIYKIHAIAIAS